MNSEKNLFFKKEFVEKYDEAVKKQKWYGAEILFGMIYEHLKANDKILDIGIGTGLSAIAFHKSGLEVYGLDYSDEMLKACKQRNIAVDLQQFDLNNTPLPYQTNYFNHVSANAVLYFIPKLDALFSEISRILKKLEYGHLLLKSTPINNNPNLLKSQKVRTDWLIISIVANIFLI